jgi:hypothetical protein
MNAEQAVLDAFERGKALGYAEGMKAMRHKELTDEEIEDECRKAWGLHDQDQLNLAEVFKFARAILRKAQEK